MKSEFVKPREFILGKKMLPESIRMVPAKRQYSPHKPGVVLLGLIVVVVVVEVVLTEIFFVVVDVVVVDVEVLTFSTKFIAFPFKMDSKMPESSKSILFTGFLSSVVSFIFESSFFTDPPSLDSSLKIELKVFFGLNLGAGLGAPSLILPFADGLEISLYLFLKISNYLNHL